MEKNVNSQETVRPLEPSFVTPVGLVLGAAVFAVCWFIFGRTDFSSALRLIVSVCLAGAAEVSVSNLVYARRLRTEKGRVFLPEINDVPATVTVTIGARRRRGGKVVFELDGKKVEAYAITMDENQIAPGTAVNIRCADTDKLLLVERA